MPTSESVPALRTPHSGYHYEGLPRDFFEGWYFRVVLPDGESFAVMYSIEDPAKMVGRNAVGVQVMGPKDGYICQYSKDVDNFWGNKNLLSLGHCFTPQSSGQSTPPPKSFISPKKFHYVVKYGFQCSPQFQQGSIHSSDRDAPGVIAASVGSCAWAYSIKPVYGWGDAKGQQKSTAGWVAALPVFEPHWQVTQALGRASGWVKWGEKVIEFQDAPAYSEKNWGIGFPQKWFWIQCNSFDKEDFVAVTAVGAVRDLPFANLQENVGMIGVHWNQKLIELVPWEGGVYWECDPWGRWFVRASNSEYEAEIEATAKGNQGTVLRAPTSENGLAPHCRDTFHGNCILKLWRLKKNGSRDGTEPILVAKSTTAALEVGGGPWWTTWKATAEMKEPLRSLVKLPVDVNEIVKFAPPQFWPAGL